MKEDLIRSFGLVNNLIDELGDLNRLVDSLDQNRQLWVNIDKSASWKYWFRDNDKISALPFKTLDQLLLPFNPDSIMQEPWDLDQIPAEHQKRHRFMMGHTTVINGFTKANNTAGVVYACGVNDIHLCPIAQKFKTYLNYFDREPFREHADGTVQINCRDTAFTLRFKLTMNCLWQWIQHKPGIDDNLICELWEFMFMNPQRNCLQMKDWKHVFMMVAFAGSDLGYKCLWLDQDLENPVHDRMDKWNEAELLIAYEEELTKNAAEMRAAGLTLIPDRLVGLSKAPVNDENLAFYSFAVFLEAVTGYWRGDFPKIFKESIEETMSSDVPSDPPFRKHLERIWADFAVKWEIPDKNAFIRHCVTELTTRSAGEIPVNVQSVKFTLFEEEFTWKLNDKMLAFFYDPGRFFNETVFKASLTKDDPGLVFLRNVMSRKDRAVFGGKLIRHLLETLIVRQLMAWQGEQQLNGHPVFTLELDTGRAFTDHREWLFRSAIGDAFILLIDYSNYDQTERFANTRKHALHAIETALQNRVKKKIMWDKDAVELLAAHWNSLEHAVYQLLWGPGEDESAVKPEEILEKENVSDNNNAGQGATKQQVLDKLEELKKENEKIKETNPGLYRKRSMILLTMDFVFSGEFITLGFNNMTNYAITLEMLNDWISLEAFAQFLEFITVRLQGDDSITLFRVLSAYRACDNHQKAAFIRSFVKEVSDRAEANGLKISAVKTGLRRGSFEFLKKMGIYGYFVPRYLQIVLNESERVSRTEDPIARMTSRIGQLRDWIWRGGTIKMALRRMYYEWNLIRVVKTSRRREYLLPIEYLWVPLRFGGCGALPFNILDPNTDIVIMIGMDAYSEKVRKVMSLIVYCQDKAPASVLDEISEQIGPQLQLESFTKEWDDQDRLLRAKVATDKLFDKYGYKMKNPFHERYDNLVKDTISDNPKAAKFKATDKARKHRAILREMNRLTHISKTTDAIAIPDLCPEILRSLEITLSDELEDAFLINPVAGLDAPVASWLRNYGTSSEGSVSGGNIFKVFNKITGDPGFPKNMKGYRPESMAKEILDGNLITAEQILLYLVAKGANPQAASEVAAQVHDKLGQLMFLADLQAFSIVGEGYSAKGMKAMARVVSIMTPFNGHHLLSETLYNYGYTFSRSQPLTDSQGKYVRRRKVNIKVYDPFTSAWMKGRFGLSGALASFQYMPTWQE